MGFCSSLFNQKTLMINDAEMRRNLDCFFPYLKQIKVLTVQMWTLMGTSSERNCSQHTWCYDAMSHICYKSRMEQYKRARVLVVAFLAQEETVGQL